MDLSIVIEPKPPESKTSISPPAELLASAPAKVLQGVARLQSLASLPLTDTQVRVD